MYLYFFDLDDTICNSKKIVDIILKDKDLSKLSQREIEGIVMVGFRKYGVCDIEPLQGATYNLLTNLIETDKESIFYITARENTIRNETKNWLTKHNLWLGEEKLIMDAGSKKGAIISNILEKSPKIFAFLFDDMRENHEDVQNYKNIISCLPTLVNL